MPTTLDSTAICNTALTKIGAQAITSIQDQGSASAIACKNNFQLAYLEVSRSSIWNCLMTPAVLVQIPQVPIPGTITPSPAPDWEPLTFYSANTYLTYGGYIYIVMFDYTSTNNFQNDLTTGALTQTNSPSNGATLDPGAAYPSGWAFQYALPSDFQLLAVLNQNNVWGTFYTTGWGTDDEVSEYEIMGEFLYCNASQAVIKYVKNQPDTTQFDSLFCETLSYKLASMIATSLRQDGGAMANQMAQLYERQLRKARTKNSGERKPVRSNPITSSLFIGSRYRGVNG